MPFSAQAADGRLRVGGQSFVAGQQLLGDAHGVFTVRYQRGE